MEPAAFPDLQSHRPPAQTPEGTQPHRPHPCPRALPSKGNHPHHRPAAHPSERPSLCQQPLDELTLSVQPLGCPRLLRSSTSVFYLVSVFPSLLVGLSVFIPSCVPRVKYSVYVPVHVLVFFHVFSLPRFGFPEFCFLLVCILELQFLHLFICKPAFVL